jgi:hypothetical protein
MSIEYSPAFAVINGWCNVNNQRMEGHCNRKGSMKL